MSDGGKGSRPRPYSVSQQEYDNRWDAIFGRDQESKKSSETAETEALRMNKEGKLEQLKEGTWEPILYKEQ